MATIPNLDIGVIRDQIARLARDTIFNLIDPKDPKSNAIARESVKWTLTEAMGRLKQKELINDYCVEVTNSQGPLAECDIPKDACPGDRVGRSGIVVSSDGNGKGVVLDPLAPAPDPTTLRVRVTLRVPYTFESIVIECRLVDTTY